MKKLIALLLAAVMLLALAACAAKPSEPAPAADAPAQTPAVDEAGAADTEQPSETGLSGEITFATTFTNYADTTITALAEAFMQENPGTTIHVQAIGDAEQEISMMMASNTLPDISPVLSHVTADEFSDYYMPIDGMYTEDTLYGYQAGVGTDGHLYGLNSAAMYFGMVYNKAVFREAGIEKMPVTMEEFFDACEKIKAIGATPVACNYKDVWPLAYYANYYASAYEGCPNVMNEQFGKDELITAGGGYEAALTWIGTMNDSGYLEPDLMSTNWEGSKTDMASGKVAMMACASFLPQQIIDCGASAEDMGMFPYPGTKAVILSSDWRYAISRNTENPELAYAFLNWLWEDGRFAQATGMTCPLVGFTHSDAPWLDELLGAGVPVLMRDTNSTEVAKMCNELEYDFEHSVIQGYLTAEDKPAYIAEINARWASGNQ